MLLSFDLSLLSSYSFPLFFLPFFSFSRGAFHGHKHEKITLFHSNHHSGRILPAHDRHPYRTRSLVLALTGTMPTYEQKKKYNTNRFYKRLKQKKMKMEWNREVGDLFPRSALTKLSGVLPENSGADYGGRNAALNFPETAPPRETVGTLSIGRRYENGQKETAFGRETCLKSQRLRFSWTKLPSHFH